MKTYEKSKRQLTDHLRRLEAAGTFGPGTTKTVVKALRRMNSDDRVERMKGINDLARAFLRE